MMDIMPFDAKKTESRNPSESKPVCERDTISSMVDSMARKAFTGKVDCSVPMTDWWRPGIGSIGMMVKKNKTVGAIAIIKSNEMALALRLIEFFIIPLKKNTETS
jgi:hypothetical protein